MSDVADVSDVHAASIFRVRVSNLHFSGTFPIEVWKNMRLLASPLLAVWLSGHAYQSEKRGEDMHETGKVY
jgi:hypothetical protein